MYKVKNYQPPKNAKVLRKPPYDYTIQCPECKQESYVSEWDECTANAYIKDLELISNLNNANTIEVTITSINDGWGREDLYYICPKCKKLIYGTFITAV